MDSSFFYLIAIIASIISYLITKKKAEQMDDGYLNNLDDFKIESIISYNSKPFFVEYAMYLIPAIALLLPIFQSFYGIDINGILISLCFLIVFYSISYMVFLYTSVKSIIFSEEEISIQFFRKTKVYSFKWDQIKRLEFNIQKYVIKLSCDEFYTFYNCKMDRFLPEDLDKVLKNIEFHLKFKDLKFKNVVQ